MKAIQAYTKKLTGKIHNSGHLHSLAGNWCNLKVRSRYMAPNLRKVSSFSSHKNIYKENVHKVNMYK